MGQPRDLSPSSPHTPHQASPLGGGGQLQREGVVGIRGHELLLGDGLRVLPWLLPPQTTALSFCTCTLCSSALLRAPLKAPPAAPALSVSILPGSRPLSSPVPQSQHCSNFSILAGQAIRAGGGKGGGQRETVWEGTDAPSNGVTSLPGEGRAGARLPGGSSWQLLKVWILESWLLPDSLPPSPAACSRPLHVRNLARGALSSW